MAQFTTIDVKAFRLNTAIQRFNQLSLQNLSLVGIYRHFGYFTFVCELVERENWKGGFNPKDRPNLSEMSFMGYVLELFPYSFRLTDKICSGVVLA